MAHVQLTQQLAQQFGKVVVVGNMWHEAGVVLQHQFPVATVIVRSEDFLVDLLGHVTQHVFTFVSKVQFHLGIVGNRSRLVTFFNLHHAAS